MTWEEDIRPRTYFTRRKLSWEWLLTWKTEMHWKEHYSCPFIRLTRHGMNHLFHEYICILAKSVQIMSRATFTNQLKLGINKRVSRESFWWVLCNTSQKSSKPWRTKRKTYMSRWSVHYWVNIFPCHVPFECRSNFIGRSVQLRVSSISDFIVYGHWWSKIS